MWSHTTLTYLILSNFSSTDPFPMIFMHEVAQDQNIDFPLAIICIFIKLFYFWLSGSNDVATN